MVKKEKNVKVTNFGDAVYCLGMIGAVIYFVKHAETFGVGLLGILKAVVWPAIVVYRILELLKL